MKTKAGALRSAFFYGEKMEKKKLNTKKDGFDRAKRAFIAEKMVDSFNSSKEFKGFGSYIQSIGIEAINFSFKYAPFDYFTFKEGDEDAKIDMYEFVFDFRIPGTDHTLKISKAIKKMELMTKV